MSVLVGVFVTLTLAALVRIAAGFGFSLVSVPPLALLLDPVTAVVIAATLAVPLNLWVAVGDRAHVDRRGALVLLVCSLAGVPFGLWALNVLSESTLLSLIAVTVVAGTLLVGLRVRVPGGMSAAGGMSALSGASFAATAIDGPILVAGMQGSRLADLEPREQRATLAVVFSATSVATLVGFGFGGQLTPEVGTLVAVGVPALLVGTFAGERLFRRLNAELFRRTILVLLVVSSVSMLTRVVTA
ncbi:sulfite exporter TauE/SafE family protein [Nocardiopsis sp. JB363]|uniref:sulfite exporter TauE/SafE family protein n=1 Tax=Nocardiopsis sp. JB363 TaxID=1434837 RepID=UPI00097ADE82|nr:sulfite exporter TauE/SafE family protein [Nocardiopsis sp. JB363]SIO85442.1 Bll0704 protein [Nocardiopsis sp. JB363]